MQILVIEDEPRIRMFLTRGLAAEGFAVEEREDGRTGLQRALEHEYDLIVLDLLLPELDGFSLLRELHERRPAVPVMILSARTDLEAKLRGFALGACDYLAKPFSFDELLARVRVQLRKHAPDVGGPSLLRVGTVTLDLARRQARIGDDLTELTAREFQVLHHLLQHAGEVVSRERLLSEVWGYQFDPGSNVVDVCIRRLRKKLGPGAPIETVRHAGYRVSAA